MTKPNGFDTTRYCEECEERTPHVDELCEAHGVAERTHCLRCGHSWEFSWAPSAGSLQFRVRAVRRGQYAEGVIEAARRARRG